jgi:hypothetical protein
VRQIAHRPRENIPVQEVVDPLHPRSPLLSCETDSARLGRGDARIAATWLPNGRELSCPAETSDATRTLGHDGGRDKNLLRPAARRVSVGELLGSMFPRPRNHPSSPLRVLEILLAEPLHHHPLFRRHPHQPDEGDSKRPDPARKEILEQDRLCNRP